MYQLVYQDRRGAGCMKMLPNREAAWSALRNLRRQGLAGELRQDNRRVGAVQQITNDARKLTWEAWMEN